MSELVDQARLAELEAVVDRGLQTFFEVGSALLEIRENKLYRDTHKTFTDYCRHRFGFTDSRGRQLIAAAKTVTAVTLLGLPVPSTEREARELGRRIRERDAARTFVGLRSYGGKVPSRNTKVKLKEVLDPLHKYLKNWNEDRLSGIFPADAKRLLKVVQEIDHTLLEVERALEERTIVSRALR